MNRKKLSRRDFLRISALATASAVFAACGPKATPEPDAPTEDDAPTAEPQASGPANIVVMYPSNEFTEAHREQLKNDYNIEIEFLEEDGGRLNAMWAAGSPPDIWRTNAIGVGPQVMRKQLLPLNDFMDSCESASWDDMYPVYKQLMYGGPIVGSGKLYGIPKDWSPEFMLFCNEEAFEEADLEIPSDEEPLSWEEVGDLARKLTKREGDRTLRWGFSSHYGSGNGPNPEFLLEILPQIEGATPLYGESMERINMDNDAVKSVWSWFTDLAKEFDMPSVLDPAPTWFGQLFNQGNTAMVNTGYWYGAMAESEVTEGKVRVLPAPYWKDKSKRRDTCVFATSTVIGSKCEDPYAAWTVVEYYSFKEPAEERAKSGWGVPLLKKMVEMVPQDTAFNAQRYKVLQNELPFAQNQLTYNPFQPNFVEKDSYMEQYLNEEIAFDEAIQAIEEETNASIQDNIDRLL